MPTDVVLTTGQWTPPANVVSPVTIRAYGSGGDGGDASNALMQSGHGGGGGGGAYAEGQQAVVGGVPVDVTVSPPNGTDRTGTIDVYADYGRPGGSGSPGNQYGLGGVGGHAENSQGAIKRDGGDGHPGFGFDSAGSGGGCAGPNSDGGNAVDHWPPQGISGGGNAGAGGLGKTSSNGTGGNADQAGGGGGGAFAWRYPPSGSYQGGTGGGGRVEIEYEVT